MESQTIQGIRYAASKLLNLPWASSPNTLNSFMGDSPSGLTEEPFKPDWFILGNGGYANADNPPGFVDGDLPITFTGRRDGFAGILYNTIPLRHTLTAEPLSGADKLIYGLKVTRVISNVSYDFYFARRSTIKPDLNDVVVMNTATGEQVDTLDTNAVFTPSRHVDGQNGVPSLAMSSGGVVSILITVEERALITSACDLWYESEGHDLISEIGICIASYNTTIGKPLYTEMISSTTVGPYLAGSPEAISVDVTFGGEVVFYRDV